MIQQEAVKRYSVKGNLAIAPTAAQTDVQTRQYWSTLGDLHGNLPKMLYFLIQEGIIKPPDGSFYDGVFSFFMKMEELYVDFDAELNSYTAVLNELRGDLSLTEYTCYAINERENQLINMRNEIHNYQAEKLNEFIHDLVYNKEWFTERAKYRSLGDNFVERNGCIIDVLTLFGSLIDNNVSTEIIVSNHDIELMLWLEKKIRDNSKMDDSFSPFYLAPTCGASATRLNRLIETGHVKMDGIIAIYKKCESSFELSSYDETDTGELLIYWHAPMNESIMLAVGNGFLAQHGQNTSLPIMTPGTENELTRLCVTLNAQTTMLTFGQTKRLADLLNDVFQYHRDNHHLDRLWGTPNYDGLDPFLHPFQYCIWNRFDPNLYHHPIYLKPKNTRIYCVHGHEPFHHKHCITLDNLFGKEYLYPNNGVLTPHPHYTKGELLFFRSLPSRWSCKTHTAYEERFKETFPGEHRLSIFHINAFLRWLEQNRYLTLDSDNMHDNPAGNIYQPTNKLRQAMPELIILIEGLCSNKIKKVRKSPYLFPDDRFKFHQLFKEIDSFFQYRPALFISINISNPVPNEIHSDKLAIKKRWFEIKQKMMDHHDFTQDVLASSSNTTTPSRSPINL